MMKMDKKKKVMNEYEADIVMRQFVEWNAVASMRFNEWMSSFEKLKGVENDSGDSIVEYAQKMYEQDKPLISRLMKLHNRLEKLQGSSAQSSIRDVFTSVFNKMASRTKEVVGKDSGSGGSGRKITVGSTGFGLRWNVQSEAIHSFNDMCRVLEKKDEILVSMNNMRGMKPWCERLERFSAIVSEPDIFSDDRETFVDLPRPVLLPTLWRVEHNGIKDSRKIAFSTGDVLSLIYKDERGDDGESTHSVLSKSNVGCGFSYLQLRANLKEIVEELEVRLVPHLDKGEGVVKELQDEFKTELTMQAL